MAYFFLLHGLYPMDIALTLTITHITEKNTMRDEVPVHGDTSTCHWYTIAAIMGYYSLKVGELKLTRTGVLVLYLR